MTLAAQKNRPPGTRPLRRRDAAATRERVLNAALAEFCEKGFSGARTASIAARAKCNIRMLYHYFGNKEGIYLAALELVYAQLRTREEEQDLLHLGPEEGMAALVEFTFDHMLMHQEFINMIGIENIQKGKFLRRSKTVPQGAMPLVQSIETLLREGQRQGIFRKKVDPIQLYVSILSLSYVHISNKHTLSITFGQDLTDTEWLDARRKHVRDIIMAFLTA
jgi:AcrR family transcriptional regulator